MARLAVSGELMHRRAKKVRPTVDMEAFLEQQGLKHGLRKTVEAGWCEQSATGMSFSEVYSVDARH
jgi:hypothetical protein